MTDISDITDNSPNPELINHLEDMLSQAKSGELRSLFYVKGWDNDGVSEGWSMDPRSTGVRFLGGLTLAVADFTMTKILVDQDSAFRKTTESD